MSENTTPKKAKYNTNSPEARALIDEIVHGTFVKEGAMAAFPTCFPGASTPIRADEGHITSLDIAPDGIVYGGTSGRAAHVFVAMFHGITGVVFDRGTVPGATDCPAVCCAQDKFAACVNGPDGGRIITGGLSGLPFDLIQEWGFSRPPLREAGKVSSEPIVHAVLDSNRRILVGITTDHLFTFNMDSGKIDLVEEFKGSGRLAATPGGSVFGQDGATHLWRFDVSKRALQRRAVELPPGDWSGSSLTWSRAGNSASTLLYTADSRGTLYSLSERDGFSPALGRTLLAPVGPMAATHDGRIFGFCGPDMAKMFCYNPRTKQMTNLGVAVSVLERRRYGYVFGDAVTGRDGQIIFGENDDLGHLWLYFPRIQAA